MAEQTDTGVPKKLEYEISLITSEGIVYTDIQYVMFVRAPILNQASYCTVQINIPTVTVEHMEINLNANIHDIWNMQIFSVNKSENDSKEELIFSKSFAILLVEKLQKTTYHEPTILVRLTLANPILHDMATSTEFNQIISGKTAYEAIEQFEDFIDEKHGKFYRNHIGSNELRNNFRYEQIVTPPTLNTLNIPKYLINTYKPFHAYSLFFFDDFYFSDKSNSDITCHFLNFADIYNQFIKYEIRHYVDFVRMTSLTDVKDFSDPARLLDRDISSIIYKTKDIFVNFLKQTKSTSQQLEMQQSTDYTYIDKMKKVPNSNLQQIKNKKSVRASIVTVPDNISNASKRLETARDLMFQKFQNLITYETTNSVPFWMHFGYLYNIDSTIPDDFIYTPISIINIFSRNEQKGIVTRCDHMCKYVMLKLVLDSNK